MTTLKLNIYLIYLTCPALVFFCLSTPSSTNLRITKLASVPFKLAPLITPRLDVFALGLSKYSRAFFSAFENSLMLSKALDSNACSSIDSFSKLSFRPAELEQGVTAFLLLLLQFFGSVYSFFW